MQNCFVQGMFPMRFLLYKTDHIGASVTEVER